MSDHSLSVTLKAGTGYDSPWIVVYGNSPDEVEAKLRNTGQLIEATVEAANMLKAANNAAPLATGGPDAQTPQVTVNQQINPPTQTNGWGSRPQQQAAPAQQGGGASHPNAQLHPEGNACDLAGCGKVLEFKKTQSGKAKWQCPDWRWNNGNPNGHGMEWAN